MHRLTFRVISQDEERTVEGELRGDTLHETHQNRPNWRIEDDGSVTLLSASGTVTVPEFGDGAELREVNRNA